MVLNDGVNTIRRDRPRNTRTKQDDSFKVSDHNIDEVKAYAEAHPDEMDALLAAEKAGQNRKTLVEWLEQGTDDGSDS